MNLRNRILVFFVTMAMVLNNLLSPVSVWYGEQNAYAAELQDVTTASPNSQTTNKDGGGKSSAAGSQSGTAGSGSSGGQAAAPLVLKKTVTAGKEPAPGEPDTRRTYDVQVTCDANAGIPEGAELEVSEVQAKDEQKKAAREQLKLAEHDRVVAETYLKVAIKAGGKEVQPTAPVEVVVETASMAPAYSDAVEVVVLGEKDNAVTVENLTGKRDDGTEDEKPTTTKLRLKAAKLGEFGLAAVVAPFDTWVYNGQTTALLGPRNKQAAVSEVLYDEQVVDGKTLLRTVTFQTEPAHAWHPALWAESRLGEGHDAAAGAVSCWRWEDGRATAKVFGEAGTSSPVAIASEGEYAFVLEEARPAEAQPAESSAPAAEPLTPIAESTSAAAQEPDQQQSAPAQAPAQTAAEGAQSAPGAQTQSAPGTKLEGSGAKVAAEDRSLRQTYTASDGRTYRVTVSAAGGAGIPENAELTVSEVAHNGTEYLSYAVRATNALGIKANNVSLVKALDITLTDPLTGKELQPTEDVQVSVELLKDNPNDYESTGVVHMRTETSGRAEKAEIVSSTVHGKSIDFNTDGFSVYVIVLSEIEVPEKALAFSLASGGSSDQDSYIYLGETESISLSTVLEMLGITDSITSAVVQDANSVNSLTINNDNYTLSTTEGFSSGTVLVNGTITINIASKPVVVVEADNKEVQYGEDPELTATVKGLPDGADPINYTLSIDDNTSINVGEYVIRPTGAASQGEYVVVYKTGKLTISQATAIVKADNLEKVAGAAEPTYTATVEGLKNGDTKDVLTYSLSRPDKDGDDGEKSGEHTIEVEGEESQGNYIVQYQSGTLTIQKLTISFLNGGDNPLRTCRLELNQSIGEENLAGAEKTGCDFDGWYTENGTEKITKDSAFTKDTDLYAHFNVKVSFEVGAQSTPIDPISIPEGGSLGDQLPGTSKEGYRFDGWYRDPHLTGEKVKATDTFNVHTTLYAKFVEQVTVNFKLATTEANGTTTESVGESINIDKGTSLDQSKYPEITIPAGYAFKGWFVGDTQIDDGAEHPIDADATVTARVVKQTTITYNPENGQEATTDVGDVNREVSFPSAPALDGATFKGWYDGDKQVSNNEGWTTDAGKYIADSDKTLTAHYTVTVTFHVKDADYSQDSIPATPVVIDKGTAVGDKLLETPIGPGQNYDFRGWFIADEDGKPSDTQVTKDTPAFDTHKDVVAKFVRQVKVEFHNPDKDPTLLTEKTADVGGTVDLIDNPHKDGFRFDGWFDDNQGGKRITNAEGVVDDQGNLVKDNEGNPLRTLTVTDDMKLSAHFVEQITVEFIVVHPETRSDSTGYPSLNSEGKYTIDKTDDGVGVPESVYQHSPTVNGYQFQGWYHINTVSDNATDYNESDGSSRFVIPNSADGKVYELGDLAYSPDDPTNYPKFKDSTILVAKFAKVAKITFRYESGGEGRETKYECLVGKPLSEYYLPLEQEASDPSAYKVGYRIEWMGKDGEKVDPSHVVGDEDNNTFYDARYIQQVTVTFQKADGTQISSTVKDINAELGTLPNVDQTDGEGRQLMGWFDVGSGRQYTATTILTGDVTLRPKYGYTVTFKVPVANNAAQYTDVTERLVAPGEALGWLPSAPYRAGQSFRNWTQDSEGNTPVDGSFIVNKNEIIYGHYDAISIYTVTVNYKISTNEGLEPNPTDTKILTVDRSAITADAPATVESPSSFNKSDGTYYPVMKNLLIIPSGNSLGVKEKHADVTVETDSTDPTKITITVPYKKSDATYTVQYMLKELQGDGYALIESTAEQPNPVNNLPGVIGATVFPEVRNYEFADFKEMETGILENNGQVFKVYYTRKYLTLSFDTKGGRPVDSINDLYGTVIGNDRLPTPTRDGYDFDGWYTGVDGDTYINKVTNGYTLKGNATLYAKWKAKSVNYSIVYMFEKYNDAGTASSFVYDSSVIGSGLVGDTVRADAGSIPTKTRTGWEKDNARNAASSIEIKADGTSVLYVYYKLIEYTFKFRPGIFNYDYWDYDVTASLKEESKTGNNDYTYQFTAKLGQGIADQWLSAGNGTIRMNGKNYRVYFGGWGKTTGGSTYVTKRLILTEDMLPTSGTIVTYKGRWLASTVEYTVNYYLQNADDDGYTKSSTYSQTYNSSANSNLSPKDIAGYTVLSHKETDWSGEEETVYDTPAGYPSSEGNTYNFYYNRDTYKIDYYYGSTRLKTIDDVRFDANIKGNKYTAEGDRQLASIEDDYIWDGWYSDSACTTKYTFDKMPATNLVLYAKWHAPSYDVRFHLNFDGATPNPYFVRTVEKHKRVTDGIADDDLAKLESPTSAPAHQDFQNWYTDPTDGAIFDIANKTITADMDVYAHWKPKPVSYTVNYYKANTTEPVHPSKTMSENLVYGQSITETAPYVTGYAVDKSSKTIEHLKYEDNVINFYYTVKPETINYRVRYVLYADKDKPEAEQRHVAPDKTGTVSGSYTSVTETAVEPTVVEYKDYRPTKVTDTLSLGTDESELTFYYTKGTHVQVQWLDMEDTSLRAAEDEYLKVGEKYTLDTDVSGYTLSEVKKNGFATDEREFTATSDTEEITIQAYYRKNLTILAKSDSRPYRENEALTMASSPSNVTTDGLKNGHTLSGITITGGQTNVGSSNCTPSNPVITGFTKEGLTPADFYNITFLPGTLTVTKVNVVVSVEPDRRTGYVYDGKDVNAGFTNKDQNKTIADYVIINNDDYKNAYLIQLWSNLKDELMRYGSNNNKIEYAEVQDGLAPWNNIEETKTGLQILNKRDAGDYYEESSVFLSAASTAIAKLPDEAKDNYNIILYARESRLEIDPVPLNIKTEGGEKSYDGTPLTNPNLTVKVSGTKVDPVGQSYTLVEGDTVDIKTTGSQTHNGTSQNIYEITWGNVRQENYSVSEDLGILEVKGRPIIIEAQNIYKSFGAASDPAYAVKVYPGKLVTDESGNPVLDEHGNQKMVRDGDEIPAVLTHWVGNNYTLQMKDTARDYTDNLSLKIARADGPIPGGRDLPGVYAITPDWAENAIQNYNVSFVDGKLTIAIARVSNDSGATWTYHQWLENDSYTAGNDDSSVQGAFNRAKGIGGNVIVETLCKNESFAAYGISDRYTLNKQVALPVTADGMPNLTSLTLRTTTGADFTSTVSRGYDGDSLFTNACTFTLQSITLDGASATNACNQDGGLVRVQPGGALNVNTGATLQNSKVASGRGGAVFVGGSNEEGSRGALTISAGAKITGNTASTGGNAVFVSDGCSMTMTGGSITGNNGDNVGAVEVGGTNARLIFSGAAQVYDNLMDGAQNNVCLSYDGVGVINAAGLATENQGAKIGVYVKDTADTAGADNGKLFKDHGGVLDRFGTYTNNANLSVFVNDRNGLKGSAHGTDEIIWMQPITVEARYMYNLKDFETMPEQAQNIYTMTPSTYLVMADIEYVPTIGESKLDYNSSDLENGFTIEQIERDIYDNYRGGTHRWSSATNTMIFWRGYAEDETNFNAYLESVKSNPENQDSNYGRWSFDKNSDSADSDKLVPVGNKLVLYYTEPAYLTVSNNSSHSMNNNDMKVLFAGYSGVSTGTEEYSAPVAGSSVVPIDKCAYVTKIGDVEQTNLRHASTEDLSLADKSSVTLMIPGALGAKYWIDGGFNGVIKDYSLISVERSGGTRATNEKKIKLDTDSSEKLYPSTTTPPLPMSKGNAENHHLYGGLTQNTKLNFGVFYICKITDADGNLLRVNGEIQAFKSLEEGFKAYADNTSYTTKGGAAATPAYIKMLIEDYDLKLSDKIPVNLGDQFKNQIPAPANKLVTLTTAATTDEELSGPYEGTADTRCVINRGACTDYSMFSVPGNANLTTQNIVFDGGAVFVDGVYQSGGVTANGGILNVDVNGALTVSEGTTMRNTAVVGYKNYGGAIYAKGTLTVSGNDDVGKASVVFENCRADYDSKDEKTDTKDGKNGAIYTEQTNPLYVSNATFSYCSALNGAGAIEILKAESTFTNCRFEYCANNKYSDGKGAGAIRSNGEHMTVTDCEFDHCTSLSQGGAIFHQPSSGSFAITGSSFNECRAGDLSKNSKRAAGAMETQAAQVTVDGCSFTDCSATTNAGAINIWKKSGNFTVNVSNSTFERCQASLTDTSNGYGGALRINGQGNSVITVTDCTFSDCKAVYGGAISSLNGKVTIEGTKTSVNGCSSTKQGGGVHLKDGTLAINDGTIMNCNAPEGGGIYQGGGTCNINGGAISHCTASNNGGGLMLAKGKLNVNGATQITYNTATNNGGGVALGGGTFTINGVANTGAESEALISHNVAKRGGGIIVQGGAQANIYGGRVIQNRATVAGGGIASEKNKSSLIFFQGDVQVYDNHLFSNGVESRQQCNVLLDHPNTTIINTTKNGLSADAVIGVYVDGRMGKNETDPYKSCGGYRDDFGSYEGSTASKNNLGAFINDRNGMYGEVDSDKPGEKLIRWQNYLCKLTDSNGNLLRYKQGDVYRRAVFTTLQDAFNHADDQLYVYYSDDSGNEYPMASDINLEMLMDYTQPASDLATMEAPRKITMKTANTEANANPAFDEGTVDVYIYDKNGDDNVNADDRRATITRGENGKSMLTVDNASSTLTIMNLVLDGNRDAGYESSTEGGIVWAKQGTLRLTSDTSSSSKYATNGSYGGNSYDEARDAVLRNSVANTTNCRGGAVRIGAVIDGNSTDASLVMDGHAQILNSRAWHGGGIHVGNDSGGSTATIGGNALVQECTAPGYGGGIFVHNAAATVKDSAQIDSCSADDHGGGINIGWAAAGTSQTRKLTVTDNAQITNCSAPYGGGINVENTYNTMSNVANISGSVTLSNCKATTQGGAINVEGGAHVTSTGASITNNTAPEGAAIALIGAATYHMGSDRVTGNLSTANPGGAIAVKSAEGRIAFEGAPLVYGNFNRVTHQQQNVVLEYNSNLVINAGALTGSNATGSIVGIYVTGTMADNEANDTTPFAEHGREGEPFGTYDANGSGTDTTKLGVFVNDRIASLAGSKGTNGKEIVWAPADKVPFAVTKTWSHLNEDGTYTTRDADDPEIRNRTVYFELYKVTGGSGGAVVDDHGTNLPKEMLRNMDDVLPMDEISKVEEAVKTDPRAQSTTITFKPTHGFYYYSGSHTEWRWNSETGQSEQVTVDDTGWYIIFLDYSNNYTQVWVEGQNGEPGHLNNGLFESQSAGVKYSGNIYNYDTDRATDTTHFRWDGPSNEYWPQNIGKGDIVIYNSKYYVVWNPNGSPFSGWTEGQFGGNWFIIGDVGKMSIPSSKPVIDYATQEAAEAEEGKHTGSISAVTINPSDALIPGTATEEQDFTVIENGQPTTARRQVFKIDYSDPNWTKIIPNLDANASYYVVERKITDYERNEDGNIKYDANGNPVLTELAIKHNSYDRNGVFTVGYSYSQAGDAATIDNLTDEGQAGTEIGFTKVDGFGVPLAENVNATFELYAMNDSGTVDQDATAVTLTVGPEDDQTNDTKVTSGSGGVVKFTVANGIYVMRETSVPSGYATSADEWAVVAGSEYMTAEQLRTIKPNVFGDITDDQLTAQTNAQMDATDEQDRHDKGYAIFRLSSADSNGIRKALAAPDITRYGLMNASVTQRKVILRKVGTEALDSNGNPTTPFERLEGAEFTLYEADWAVREEGITSDESGLSLIENLPVGTYYLTETKAPDASDYAGNQDRCFKLVVKEDGNSIEALASYWEPTKQVVITAGAGSAAGSAKTETTNRYYIADADGKEITAANVQSYHGGDQVAFQLMCQATVKYAATPTTQERTETREPYKVDSAVWSASPSATIDAGGMATFDEVESRTEVTVSAATMPNSDVAVASATVSVNPSTYTVVLDRANATYAAGSTATAKLMKNNETAVTGVTWNITTGDGSPTVLASIDGTGNISFSSDIKQDTTFKVTGTYNGKTYEANLVGGPAPDERLDTKFFKNPSNMQLLLNNSSQTVNVYGWPQSAASTYISDNDYAAAESYSINIPRGTVIRDGESYYYFTDSVTTTLNVIAYNALGNILSRAEFSGKVVSVKNDGNTIVCVSNFTTKLEKRAFNDFEDNSEVDVYAWPTYGTNLSEALSNTVGKVYKQNGNYYYISQLLNISDGQILGNSLNDIRNWGYADTITELTPVS